MEHLGVDSFDSELSSVDRMVVVDCQLDAMAEDSLASTIPVSNPIDNLNYESYNSKITYCLKLNPAACVADYEQR